MEATQTTVFYSTSEIYLKYVSSLVVTIDALRADHLAQFGYDQDTSVLWGPAGDYTYPSALN